ncbi:MAG: nitroreductase family protein [Phycisphaeraceae bacterium]|nr:nitroreductase family protein [Phycisphaerales bacterium]MCB9860559.1 nitroreductase family protein [Phycisphaeraceae bacterium]
MSDHVFISHRPYTPSLSPEQAAGAFYETMAMRRTVREYADKPVSRETIEMCVRAAGTAPSGAHKQPWRFVAVADPVVKSKIRAAAEEEEREFYARRANEEWLHDLAPFGTDPNKPFLETAPWVVVVFKMMKTDTGGQVYYVNESVGIAVGLFLAAAHHAGLATLTHTPSPMGFLSEVLGRPDHERPYVVIPVGYPAENCVVPKLERKPLDEIFIAI